MREAAQKLDFEKAIELRDAMNALSRGLAEKQKHEQKSENLADSAQ
jgi:excinuclease UvrABC nuclease subunit